MTDESRTEIDVLGHNAQTGLRNIVERLLRVEADMDELKEDRKEVYAEAKAFGLDRKIVRKIVARERADKAKLAEEEALLDLYITAMLGTTNV